MLEGLDEILAGSDQPGVIELRMLLQELLGGGSTAVRLTDQQTLKHRAQNVFRLRFAVDGGGRSVVVKRLEPQLARRNELVAQRWLPAVRLHGCGPPLLGSVASRSGVCVWHVYDDLGQRELDRREPDRDSVRAAVELIAQVHTRFARHALLGEVRLHGGDLGIHFYENNVNDAISALEALRGPAVCERLLDRLYKLRDELPERARIEAELGGPETLLHGDLWAINVFVIPTDTGLRARLIDWDHAAVGPASYDLSTFLLRFPVQHRPWVLDLYQQAIARDGWRLPSVPDLNRLFETHEYARYANRIIWPAIAHVVDHAQWAVDELAEIDQWFENFGAVLARETGTRAENPRPQ